MSQNKLPDVLTIAPQAQVEFVPSYLLDYDGRYVSIFQSRRKGYNDDENWISDDYAYSKQGNQKPVVNVTSTNGASSRQESRSLKRTNNVIVFDAKELKVKEKPKTDRRQYLSPLVTQSIRPVLHIQNQLFSGLSEAKTISKDLRLSWRDIRNDVLLSPDRNVHSYSSQILGLTTKVEYIDLADDTAYRVGRRLTSSVSGLTISVPMRPSLERVVPNTVSWVSGDHDMKAAAEGGAEAEEVLVAVIGRTKIVGRAEFIGRTVLSVPHRHRVYAVTK